jgi:tetratricopeptide (TPR) repeat protein
VLLEQARLLREQIALARNERFRNRIKAARDLSLAGLVLAMAAAAAWVAWDASRADGVVVERFTVPPELAARGLGGDAVANRLLDELQAMNAAVPAWGRPEGEARGVDGDLRVEIPQAGVSFGELTRHLRRTLGRERVITGEFWMRGDQLAASARVSGSPPDRASGPAGDPEVVVRDLAERVMMRIQPNRYGDYLFASAEGLTGPARQQRLREAAEVYRRATNGPQPARAYANWGDALLTLGDFRGLALVKAAARIDPNLGPAQAGLAIAYIRLGEPQLVAPHAEAGERAFLREGRGSAARYGAHGARAMRALVLRAEGSFHELAVRSCAATDDGEEDLRNTCALSLAQSHDGPQALRRLEEGPQPSLFRSEALAYAAESRGDWNAVASALEAQAAQMETLGLGHWGRTSYLPRTVIALARSGRAAEAEALSARMPGCYDCLRARGWAAAARGDAAAAERWFAQAVTRGPVVPWAYQNQAETRLLRGDLAGAISAARQAQARGPGWADPFKVEGDALARRGDDRDAVGRYREAAERAPRWGALHLAWGRSLEALGRQQEARAKYVQAARLDLSPADRATVQRLLGRRAA